MAEKVQQRKIVHGQEELLYYLERKRVKRVNLRVKQDGTIFVSASSDVSAKSIDAWILSQFSRLQKIRCKQLERNASLLEQKGMLERGEIPFLGGKLSLKQQKGTKEEIYRQEDFLILTWKEGTSAQKKEKLVQGWLTQEARVLFEEISVKTYEAMREEGIAYPCIKIRKMTSRWGSCQPSRGVITLNLSLMGAPVFCIEYVVVHEFCHLVHPNHSGAFYALVERYMPYWKEARTYLKENAAYLL